MSHLGQSCIVSLSALLRQCLLGWCPELALVCRAYFGTGRCCQCLQIHDLEKLKLPACSIVWHLISCMPMTHAWLLISSTDGTCLITFVMRLCLLTHDS